MEKIKIAFFAEMLLEGYDGAIRTMYHIINRVPREDYEIIFICGVPPKKDIGFRVVTVPTITIPFNNRYKIALHHLSQTRLNRVLDEFEPDLVHIATPSPLGHFGLSYAERRGLPVSSIYHTHFLSYVEYYLRDLPMLIDVVKEIMRRNVASFYNRCSSVLIPTREMINELSEYGVRQDNMKLWPRGINRHIFNPDKTDRDKLRRLTGNNRPNVLFASRLVWEKNLSVLSGVYKQAKEEGKQWNFIVVGDGVARDALEKQMPEAYFTGEVDQDELAVFYTSSDVFLFPSISETYGSVVVEAMACGLPCVIADGGGSRSFIEHGKNGFLCDPDHIPSYIHHIDQVLGSPEMAERIRMNGLKYVQDLDWDKVVGQLFELWKDMAYVKDISAQDTV